MTCSAETRAVPQHTTPSWAQASPGRTRVTCPTRTSEAATTRAEEKSGCGCRLSSSSPLTPPPPPAPSPPPSPLVISTKTAVGGDEASSPLRSPLARLASLDSRAWESPNSTSSSAPSSGDPSRAAAAAEALISECVSTLRKAARGLFPRLRNGPPLGKAARSV